jgi:ribonuclease HI
MYRLDTRCTNNQADAFPILKALEHVQTNLENEDHKVATVHTDSRTTLESLYNTEKHTFLTEEIRQKAKEMESGGWKTRFRWIKSHVGNSGNEMADKLAKEASGKTEIPISCNRIPKSAIKRDLEETSKETWQREWETTNKGRTTKEYFPNVAERLQRKMNLTQNFTTLVTGHRNLKSYLYRFKIIEAPDCPCGKGNQTTEHVLYDCGILQEDRERPIAAVTKTDNWHIIKDKLIKKQYQALEKFTKQMDKSKEINT